MHEMALAEGIRDIVEDAGRVQGFARVSAVVLEIGALSAVDADSLGFCFDAVMQHGIAAGARLLIERVPGRGRCPACAADVAVAALYDPCPRCGGYALQITDGTQMRVKELEVE